MINYVYTNETIHTISKLWRIYNKYLFIYCNTRTKFFEEITVRKNKIKDDTIS